MTRYNLLDTPAALQSSQERPSKVHLENLADSYATAHFESGELTGLAHAARRARDQEQPVVVFIGGHVVKTGMGPLLIRMISEGLITHVAGNGAIMVHDYELTTAGKTSEWVAESIQDGTFGMWSELQPLADVAAVAANKGTGYGEEMGCQLLRHTSTNMTGSIFAAGYECNVPVTVHPLIGGDVFHPYVQDGASFGKACFTDFRIFAASIYELQWKGGVFICIGSAVHGPEVYLKALSWARNVLRQEGKTQTPFVTGVMDMYPLPSNWRDGEASEDSPGYYFRPWKTILLRSLADGGSSFYIRGRHQDTIPALLRDMLA